MYTSTDLHPMLYFLRLDMQSALLYDSLLVIAYGIMAMDNSHNLDTEDKVNCRMEKVRNVKYNTK